jgi:hypothetical protein
MADAGAIRRLQAEYEDLRRRREELLARMRREAAAAGSMFYPGSDELLNQVTQLDGMISQLLQRILAANPFFTGHYTRGRKSLNRRQNKSKKSSRSSRSRKVLEHSY